MIVLGGNERVHGVGSSGQTEQRARESGGRLLGREHVDRVPDTMDGSVTRAATQRLCQHGNRNPDVEGDLEGAGQQRPGAHVAA